MAREQREHRKEVMQKEAVAIRSSSKAVMPREAGSTKAVAAKAKAKGLLAARADRLQVKVADSKG